MNEEKRELLKQSISRESESNADINSVKMAMNIGLPSDTCLKGYEYLARHEGAGGETKEDSSHPGYEDRRKNLKDFLTDYEASEKAFLRKECTKGRWIFSRKENTLTFKIFS